MHFLLAISGYIGVMGKSRLEWDDEKDKVNRTQYQKLIRRVLDLYASHFAGS